MFFVYVNDQHQVSMYTKPVFENITKIQSRMSCYVVVLLTPTRTATVVDKIAIFCNDVNKTSTSIELLAINILRYMS